MNRHFLTLILLLSGGWSVSQAQAQSGEDSLLLAQMVSSPNLIAGKAYVLETGTRYTWGHTESRLVKEGDTPEFYLSGELKNGLPYSEFGDKPFGKVLQKRQSMTINRNDKSTSISTQMDSLIPQSKISTLTQGMFVGAVADNFDERIEQKIFHAEIVVDNERIKRETADYHKIPVISNFVDENGVDHMKERIQENYDRIKAETRQIVEDELARIEADPILSKLLPGEKK